MPCSARLALYIARSSIADILLDVPSHNCRLHGTDLDPSLGGRCRSTSLAAISAVAVLGICDYAPSGGARDACAKFICDRISLGLIAALLFGYGPVVGIAWRPRAHVRQRGGRQWGVAEIDQTLSANPGLRVAVGPGLSSFFAQGLEVIPVFRGNPLPIDTSAWMNLRMNGVNDQAVLNLIKKCPVDIWLIPNWKPFSDYYNYTEEVYPKAVIDAFHESLELRASGKVFDQWWCFHTVRSSQTYLKFPTYRC